MFKENKEIVDHFYQESKSLTVQLVELLEKAETDIKQAKRLEAYAQTVDRIMGAATSIALAFPDGHLISKIGDVAAICKAVGYKAAKLTGNEQFYQLCIALLLDATEILEEMLNALNQGVEEDKKEFINKALVERLQWVSGKFNSEIMAKEGHRPVDNSGSKPMAQNEIDELLKKLGI